QRQAGHRGRRGRRSVRRAGGGVGGGYTGPAAPRRRDPARAAGQLDRSIAPARRADADGAHVEDDRRRDALRREELPAGLSVGRRGARPGGARLGALRDPPCAGSARAQVAARGTPILLRPRSGPRLPPRIGGDERGGPLPRAIMPLCAAHRPGGAPRSRGQQMAAPLVLGLVPDLLLATRIEQGLRHLGYRVDLAADATALVARTREAGPELVLVDLAARGVDVPA